MTDTQQKLPVEDTPPVDRRIADERGYAPFYDRIGISVEAPENGRALDFDWREHWRILNKRKWLIASFVGAFGTVGLLRILMATPLYTSTIRIQIDRYATKVVESGNVTPAELFDLDFMKTQYELLQSRSMAERVAALSNIASDPDFDKPAGFSLTGLLKGPDKPVEENVSAVESAAIHTILANRAVRPLAGSRIVDISYTDYNPARAQRVAAAYGEAFIAFNLDKRIQATAYARTFLEDQISQLKLRLEDSEKVLLDFAQKEQIVAATDKGSIAESNLASANAALGNIISQRIKDEQLWKQVASATAINLPQLLDNKVIDDLRGRRNQLVTEYEERSETFRPSYPTMMQLNNKIKEIDRQLASEVKTIKSSLKAAYQSSLNQEDEMKGRVEALRTEVLDLQKRSIHYNMLKREVDTNRSLYDSLLQRFKEVDVAGGVGANNVFVIDKAELPGAPSSSSKSLVIAFAMGLAAALTVAYGLERFDDFVHSPEDAERVSSLPTLGVIPKTEPLHSVVEELANPRSATVEAYRSLCTTLQLSTETGLPDTLLITSAGAGDGKSVTSLAIVRYFALIGLKVLLIDADLRNPSLHKKLGLENDVGLTNFLTNGCSIIDVMQRTDLDNLFFMPSGPLPPNAAELLASSRLGSLLSIGLEVFDLIVIDSPPIMGLADVPLLSRATAATVLVMAAGQSRISPVRSSLKRLRMMRTPIIGTIITKYDVKRSSYGYDYGFEYTRIEPLEACTEPEAAPVGNDSTIDLPSEEAGMVAAAIQNGSLVHWRSGGLTLLEGAAIVNAAIERAGRLLRRLKQFTRGHRKR